MCWETKKQVVLIGNAECGKTALAVKLSQDLFLDCYCPTSFDDFSAEVPIKKGTCRLTVLDTSGDHEDGNVRSLAYKGCDAVIVCFDLTDQSSLDDIESKWLPELNEQCPGVPFYFAGCKRDAMCDAVEGCMCGGKCCTQSEQELLQMIERTGAVAYIECSALTSENVEELFQMVAGNASTPKRRNSAGKKIMKSLKKSKFLKRLSVFGN